MTPQHLSNRLLRAAERLATLRAALAAASNTTESNNICLQLQEVESDLLAIRGEVQP